MEKEWNSLEKRANVASCTECTGIAPTPPADREEADAVEELYALNPQKDLAELPFGRETIPPQEEKTRREAREHRRS